MCYDAWRNRRGDFSAVPLADDFQFTGPVASFKTAAGYREMAGQAGLAVTCFEVRRQFIDGNAMCSIIDWSCWTRSRVLTGARPRCCSPRSAPT